jgi:ABC-type transporter Mla maintaining outer membrane lipid asymmetry ATPase subunit MlaF
VSDAVAPAVEIDAVRKAYGGLRPFRMTRLVVARGERVALSGLDAAAAEIFTNLLTGATLPDEGTITVLGQPTAAIADEQAWLASLDRFGIVSARAVLLGGSTIAQNLAMPFTLSIDPVPADVMARVAALAADVGLRPDALDGTAGAASPEVQARAHLARAVALGPALLVLEHPTAMVPAGAVPALAADIVRLAGARSLTVLAVTEDAGFAGIVAGRRLALDPSSGEVADARAGRRWWGRG